MIAICVNNEVRKTVTPENIQADVEQLFKYASSLSGVDASKVSVFAHSEGTLHTSRLIGAKRINPKFVTFIGTVTESPKSVIYYQQVDRQIDDMFEVDANNDGSLTNEEIQSACTAGGIPQETCEKLKSPSGSWTRESLGAPYKFAYDQAAKEALAAADDQAFIPNPAKPTVQASYRWWKMWYVDDRNAMDDLFEYKGKIFAHNGDIDSQTPGKREFALLQSKKSSFASFPVLTLHPGTGHGLKTGDRTYGPMDENIEAAIVSEIIEAMK